MIEAIKTIGGIVTSLTSASVAGTILESFKPENLNKIQKVTWFIGKTSIGVAIADAAVKSFDKSVDEVAAALNMAKKVDVSIEIPKDPTEKPE